VALMNWDRFEAFGWGFVAGAVLTFFAFIG
jgi:hypothetical protein